MALTNYQVIGGAGSSQSHTGRFFNLLSAFHPLKVVLKNAGKEVISTNITSGMSFDFNQKFDEIEFYSDVTQTIKYWASDTKLDYKEPNPKENGAAFIASRVAGASGGPASILVPAEPSRRRVMLESVDGSVWIGGNDVASDDGWEVKQGERLELDVAGDVFSWWTDTVSTVLRESTGLTDGTTQLTVLTGVDLLPTLSYQQSESGINTSAEGLFFPYDGETALGQVCYIANRSRLDGVVTHFDVMVPAGKTTLVFDCMSKLSESGGVNPCVGVSWGEVDDFGGRVLWRSAFSAGGVPLSDYGSVVEIYLGYSDQPRFKRVFVWDGSEASFLDSIDANIIPARKVKIIELKN
jgi:hypothetical protein